MAPRQARHSSGRAGRSWDSRSAIRLCLPVGPVRRPRVPPVGQDGDVSAARGWPDVPSIRSRRRRPRPGVLRSGSPRSSTAVGCSSFADQSAGPEREAVHGPVVEVATSAPDGSLTLVADADPVTAAVSTSRALFDSAGLVVLAPADDAAATLLGASAAVGLGVPLLLEPQPATDGRRPGGRGAGAARCHHGAGGGRPGAPATRVRRGFAGDGAACPPTPPRSSR